MDINAVKKAVARYEQIGGAKINFDKCEGLQLGSWRVAFPCQGLSAGVMDTSASLGCGSGLGSNLSKIGRRYKFPGGYLASKVVVLKVRGGGVRYVHLPLDPLPLVCTSTESSDGTSIIPL